MKNGIVRSGDGRILGSVNYFWNNEDESYVDRKEKDLIFPNYKGNLNGEIRTYHISELKK